MSVALTHPTMGETIRHANAAALADALQAARADTLRTFAAYQRALTDLQVLYRPDLNPPLWELGHIGWFQEWWLARNSQRHLGAAADPDARRLAGGRAQADALYNSSRVPHASRWSLPLPTPDATRDDLALQLSQTLALLQGACGDAALYFFRLALLHEDMHHEAAVYMAQTLALDLEDARWIPCTMARARQTISMEAATCWMGQSASAPGFAFDNELGCDAVALDAFAIDSQVLQWGDYLPFVEGGGYTHPRWWSAAGQTWLAQTGLTVPIYLRRAGGHWQRRTGSQWHTLDMQECACHLSAHEAQAWCAWAGRRLPSEAEWLHTARQRPQDFAWGQVWEWTASPFRPFAGFMPHPYQDYSAPWFDGRPVLRGASFATQPRMRNLHYRNLFQPQRNDVPAGFRSCAL